MVYLPRNLDSHMRDLRPESISDAVLLVLEGMPPGGLRDRLIQQVREDEPRLDRICESFRQLTSKRQSPEALRVFFHNWALTNNSAVTVAGLSNRCTMLIHQGDDSVDHAHLARSVASLNRIVDEDLAVVGNILHSELFYRMATQITGDDQWQSRAHLRESAKSFKGWKDHNSLQDPDILVGLLTTLCHEIYTHGEVEFIWGLFSDWLAAHYPEVPASSLAWIKVHTGPTERNHFFHAIDAIGHWVAASGASLEDYDVASILQTYIAGKERVMAEVASELTVQVLA